MTTMVRDLTKKTPKPTAADENSTANADAGSVSDHPPYSESGSEEMSSMKSLDMMERMIQMAIVSLVFPIHLWTLQTGTKVTRVLMLFLTEIMLGRHLVPPSLLYLRNSKR